MLYVIGAFEVYHAQKRVEGSLGNFISSMQRRVPFS
jgi:hypothetical protein